MSLFLLLFLAFNPPFANISIGSSNLLHFGKTKSTTDIEFIANIIKNDDVIVIQELVSQNPGESPSVAKLDDGLNRKGSKWDYVISDITSSSSHKAERYAFIWKTSKLTISCKPWLEQKYNLENDREPFLATFKSNDKFFTLQQILY